jgi:hypothetical protein
MKKSLLFFCFAVLMNVAFAQPNTKNWNGAPGDLWSTPASWLPVGVPGASDTVIFNSANSCDLDVNPTIASLRTVGVGANITTTSGQKTMTINNNGATSPVLSVGAGSALFVGNGGGVVFITYGAGGTNNAQVAGTLTLNAFSTWEINNGANLTNVDISGVVNVNFNHGGAVFNNSTIATTRFLSGSSLNWTTGNAGTIPAADYQNGSTINVTGVSINMPVFSNAANYNGLLIWDNPGQTISGSSAILLPAANYTMDSLRVISTGTGTIRLATEPNGYMIGNVEVPGGTLEMSAPVVGASAGSIINNLEISGGTVIGNATYTGDIAAAFGTTLTVNGKLIISSGTLTLTNRPLVASSAGGFKLNVKKDVVQTGGSVNATNLFALFTNEFALTGTIAQNLTMTTFSGPIAFNINNSSAAGVTLLSNFTIPASPASLVFTSGVLNTSSANLLIIAAGGQVFGAANGSYVDGPVRKFGNTAFIFPVGKTIGATKAYVPIEISATSGPATDNFTAEYKRSTAEIYPISNAGIEHVSRVDYWILDRGGSTSSVNITLYWTATSSNGGSPNYINNLSELIIAWSNGANWINFSGLGQTTGNTTAGSIMWTSLTNTFGPFSLASTTINNPLPITLNYLNGIKQNGAHYLNWKVTCFNNANSTMVLERSADGRTFTAINTITADALRCEQPFDHTDNNPLAGLNYYRLKMIDANGKITYSTIIALLNKENGFDIVNLIPTLVTGNALLNVTAAQKTKMDIVITDISGRQVQKIAYNLIAGSNQFNVNLSNLSAGTYQMKGYTIDGVSRTVRFVKQ